MPGKQRTFEEVKRRDQRPARRGARQPGNPGLHEKVENERSAGKSLKEIAEQLKLPFREIAEIDRTGKTARRQARHRRRRWPPRSRQAAFAGAVGIEAEATELGDGGYAWVDVLGVTPEKQKPFEEVKDEVKAAASKRKRARRSRPMPPSWSIAWTRARPWKRSPRRPAPRCEKTAAVTRNTSPPGLPQNAVQQAFALPKGGATSAPTADGKARIILRVADVIAAPARRRSRPSRLKDEITRQMQSDVLGEYVAGLADALWPLRQRGGPEAGAGHQYAAAGY